MLPVFETVIVCAALAVPTPLLVKVRLAGLKTNACRETPAAQLFTRLLALTEPSPVARS